MNSAQAAESLLEHLIDLQSSSHAFRQTFQSQATTQAYITAYRSFVSALAGTAHLDQGTVRVLEKLSHFALTLSLDINVITSQKQDVGDFTSLRSKTDQLTYI